MVHMESNSVASDVPVSNPTKEAAAAAIFALVVCAHNKVESVNRCSVQVSESVREPVGQLVSAPVRSRSSEQARD